ncbi:MAG: homocysteine S-methyltransferase family protein [Vibrio sp.]
MTKLKILDGGMGRELKALGAPFSQPLWSAQALIEAPEFVIKAHRNFIQAGAQIITTNAYACVPFHLGDALYQDKGFELAQQAAQYAQVAANQANQANQEVQVAASIPPALGSYRPDLFDAQVATPIIQTLVDAQAAYVDLWLAETISSLEEFETVAAVLSQTSKPSYYAFSLQDEISDVAKIRSTETVTQAAEKVCLAQGAGILFNCSIPEVMEQAIKDAKAVFDAHGVELEIGVYANNFTPIKANQQANSDLKGMRELSAQDYVEFAKIWQQAGASIVGGCCGIFPEHIQAVSQWNAANSL